MCCFRALRTEAVTPLLLPSRVQYINGIYIYIYIIIIISCSYIGPEVLPSRPCRRPWLWSTSRAFEIRICAAYPVSCIWSASLDFEIRISLCVLSFALAKLLIAVVAVGKWPGEIALKMMSVTRLIKQFCPWCKFGVAVLIDALHIWFVYQNSPSDHISKILHFVEKCVSSVLIATRRWRIAPKTQSSFAAAAAIGSQTDFLKIMFPASSSNNIFRSILNCVACLWISMSSQVSQCYILLSMVLVQSVCRCVFRFLFFLKISVFVGFGWPWVPPLQGKKKHTQQRESS